MTTDRALLARELKASEEVLAERGGHGTVLIEHIDALRAQIAEHDAQYDAWMASIETDAKYLDEQYAGAVTPQELMEQDLQALVGSVRKLISLDAAIIFRTEQTHDAWHKMKAALERFEPWLEVEESPQQMGWVDDRGRP